MPEQLPAPYTLAMVLCDAIWIDPSNGKTTLLGTFDEIGAKRFPMVHPMFAVYILMKDGQGLVPIKLRVVDLDEEREPLFVVENDLEFSDRQAIMNMNVYLEGITFPAPGEYRVQLFARGEFVLERRLVVQQM
jgi:hypothetical protein